MLQFLWALDLFSASVVFLALNFAIFFGALAAGKIIERYFSGGERVARGKVTAVEGLLAFSTVCINSAITAGGWLLWKAGVLHINIRAEWWQIARDAIVLVLAMDAALYALHRIAHIPVFYKLAHYRHHVFRDVRVLTLFVMSPLEALGFGVLWVLTLCCFSFSIEAVAIFLNLNLFFGITAHCGVRFYAPRVERALATLGFTYPDFHLWHHANEAVNLGFYTSVWDRVFGTLLNRVRIRP